MSKFMAALFLMAALDCGCRGQNSGALVRVADIPLPGGSTRFDYQSFDPQSGRLYISHMGDNALLVFDTRGEKPIAHIEGFPRVRGVLAVPSIKRVYASAARAHEIVVVDTDALKIIKRIPGVKSPDGLAWSPETHRLFVSDEGGEAEFVIDTDKNEHIATIEMGGEVGNTQYDPTSHLIYACVQTKDQFVAIDPAKNVIAARYDLKGGKHPHGFYIDDAHRRAYIACEGNNKLLVFNLETHEVEDSLSTGWVPDVLAFDTTLNRLYVAAEMGPTTVFHWDTEVKKLIRDGEIDIGGSAHTVSVDSTTHKVYFPLKNGPVLRIMQPPDQ
jgi:DNA-binding beta-propeller fold protein YncE